MNTTSSRAIMKKLAKGIKNISKLFTIVNAQLQIIKESEYDLS